MTKHELIVLLTSKEPVFLEEFQEIINAMIDLFGESRYVLDLPQHRMTLAEWAEQFEAFSEMAEQLINEGRI